MSRTIRSTNAALAGVLMLMPGWVMAQQDDSMYVEYSDEEAAGTADYSDAVAAGESEGEAAPAVEGEGGADASWSVSTEAEGDAAGGAELMSDWDAEEPSDEPAKKESDRASLKPWEWNAIRHHSTMTGTTGLFYMAEAGSGEAGTFGMGVHGSWFKYRDYLINEDENTGMWGNINIRVTPLDFLEVHYGIAAAANYNNKENPELFQALGDMTLGLKGFYSPIAPLTIGLDVGMFMLNSVGEVALDWKGTSFGLDALLTFDLAEINRSVPVRFHLLVGYFFDRSANLIADIEEANGGCGTDLDGDRNVEYEGCLSPVERTALGIDRNDQFKIGVGLDALLPYVSPIIEYNLEIPVNRQDFICPKDAPGSYDSCMVQEGGGGFRQVLTIGARVLPPLDDLAIDIGVDIGLSGYAPTVHELAAAPPWRLLFGASYNFDPFPEPPPPPPVVAPPVEVPPPAPTLAYIKGLVHDEKSIDAPVASAVVTYEGKELNAQVAGTDGRFVSYDLAAGLATLRIEATGYHPGTFSVEIPETGEIEQAFPLRAMPRKGTVVVTVVDDKDKPLAGVKVRSEGVLEETFTTDASGTFEIQADEGKLTLQSEAEGFMAKRIGVEVAVDTRGVVQMQLRPKPKNALVVVKAKRINIRKQIHFGTDSDIIDPQSFGLMDEIADTLIGNPQIRRVEIQGHTDDRGKREHNIDLSDRRANSVRRYLIDAGVDAGRIEAKGYGPDKPVAPNITATGRARNRRVEFHIKDSE